MKYPDVGFESFFTWMNRPRIMYSPGVRRELAFEMEQLGGRNVLIVTDKGLVQAGVAEMAAEEVRKSDLDLVGIFDNIVQDARLENINEGAAFYRSCGADWMVVAGEGTVNAHSRAGRK